MDFKNTTLNGILPVLKYGVPIPKEGCPLTSIHPRAEAHGFLEVANKQLRKVIDNKKFVFSFFAALLFIGGLGFNIYFVVYGGYLVSILLLISALVLKGGKLKVPDNFLLYLIFLLTLGLSTFWSAGPRISFMYFILFLTGGVFWLSFYNLSKELIIDFQKLIVVLGIIFGALFLFYRLTGKEIPFKASTLYLPTTVVRNHNHLGDLWAAVLTILGYWALVKPKWWHGILAGLGLYFLAISLSRSAYVALIAGIAFLLMRLKILDKYRKLFTIFVFSVGVIFIFAGFHKTTLFSRPYYYQSVYGFLKNPLGIGLGNFVLISIDPTAPWSSLPNRNSIISSSPHNIVLEMMVGMGIFGLLFLAWLISVFKIMFRSNNFQTVAYRAIFLVIFVNFIFDTTYFIPTMLWLWFGSLGLAQKGTFKRFR